MRSALTVAFIAALTLSGYGVLPGAEQRSRLRPVPKLDEDVKTGPESGTKIPDFAAVDQNGRRQTFATLRGPKGLVLLFFRSADW